MKKIETIDDVEAFLLKHGENIVDMLGGEIDRIELKLRVRHYKIISESYLRGIYKIMRLLNVFFFFSEKVSSNSALRFGNSLGD